MLAAPAELALCPNVDAESPGLASARSRGSTCSRTSRHLLARPPAPWVATHAAPELGLPPLLRDELRQSFRGGEVEADECERLLASAARGRAAIDLAIAEGLRALKHGDRLAQLGYHLDDYAREVLDIGETTTRNLVRLATGLRERPLLREAVRSGRVGIRAAETVLPVAFGSDEAAWVERAEHCTVRQVDEAVRRVRAGDDADDCWMRIRTHLPDDEREIVDVGLQLAGEVEAGSTRVERLEAMLQEFLGEYAADSDPDGDAQRRLGSEFRRCDPLDPSGALRRKAALEQETERWSMLLPVGSIAAPEVTFDELTGAQEIDVQLRELAKLKIGWDDLIGWCAHVVKRSGIPALLGFATFRHYVEERLGLPARAVEQREALEAQLWASPALREARREKLSYEKLRTLSRLSEQDIRSWIPRAQTMTCIELRRQVEGERERQMRAAKVLATSMPRRTAVLLADAARIIRQRLRAPSSLGKCLAIVAAHFIQTWEGSVQGRRTRSQKVRDRDQGRCRVPGCSHDADDAHHIEYRSHGGSDDETNLVSVCAFHHHRCIHGGYLRVVGQAPDALTWFLNGEVWAASAPVLNAIA